MRLRLTAKRTRHLRRRNRLRERIIIHNWEKAAPQTGTDKLTEEKKTPFEKGIKE
jgi:hypothetical protein